jgi:hypothetical protein
MDKDLSDDDECLGQVTIPIKTLSNQMKHDLWYDLSGSKPGESSQGKIHISIQWIWSKTKYMRDIEKRW